MFAFLDELGRTDRLIKMAFNMVLFQRSILPSEDARVGMLESGMAPPGLEIFKQLFSQKLLPVDSSSGWQLSGVYHEIRTWEKKLTAMGASFVMFGCSCVINSQPETILATLTAVEKQAEWDKSVRSGEYIAYPTTTDETNYPVKVDLVSFTLSREPSTCQIIGDRIKYAFELSWEILTRGSYKARKPTNTILVARNWRLDEDQSCWLFNRNVDGGDSHNTKELWSYYFIQPVIGSQSKSILHIISCTSRHTDDAPALTAARLVALKHYFEMQTLKTRPLKHASLRHVADSRALREADILARESLMGSERGSVAGSLYSHQETEHTPYRGIHNLAGSPWTEAGASDGWSWDPYMDNSFLSEKSPSHGAAMRISVSSHKDSSSDDTGIAMSGKKTKERKRSLKRTRGNDIESSQSVSTVGGPTSGEEDAPSHHLQDYETLGHQCAQSVLEEIHRAANINVNASEADQRETTKGWVFHNLQKEVLILKKKIKKGRYHSFLGRSLIKAPPKVVYHSVRNPRTRFIYDNMLKKLDIVSTINGDMFIVHATHEVSQLLRKDVRDFCILQRSEMEGDKYVVAFRSVNPAECPLVEGVVRAKVYPSGWVIEPAGDKAQYSMVTYLTQFSLGGGKDVPPSFYKFLSLRVPLSIAYLRTFLEAQLPP